MIKKIKETPKKQYEYRNRRKLVLQNRPLSFRPTNRELKEIFNKIDGVKDKSEVIHEALNLWLDRRDNPSRLMNWLRTRYPTKWRYINRNKPYCV